MSRLVIRMLVTGNSRFLRQRPGKNKAPLLGRKSVKDKKMKNLYNKIAGAVLCMGVMASSSFAQVAPGVSYFQLPTGFVDNIIATVLVVAGGLLTIIGLKYAWNLTKSMFASR